jgi:hypothetical protein
VAIVTRTYFEQPEHVATYDYDDVLLKLLGVHVDNRVDETLSMDILYSADDRLVLQIDAPFGPSDWPMPSGQEPDVIVDGRGRVTNIYARTV